ncbi:MAG: hypothetical protein DRJ07_15170 [Bacteroidetes bacterium]|nr:MAG: hypothetical protein DRJ07_15170 [Bacteroidota bacterium]
MNKIVKVLLRILLGLILLVGSLWLYLNYDPNQIVVDVSDLDQISSKDINQKLSAKTKSEYKNIIIKNGQFYALDGR